MRILPRITTTMAAGVGALTLLAAIAPLPAVASEAFYKVTFAQPVAKQRMMAKELLWSCSGTSCIAVKSTSRAASICSALAKTGGEVVSFNAGATAFTPEEIQACNGKTAA